MNVGYRGDQYDPYFIALVVVRLVRKEPLV